jgi:hypothetical protein
VRHPNIADAAAELVPLTTRTHHFYSPHQLRGALGEGGKSEHAYRRLIAAYASLDPDELAACVAAAFLTSPSETLVHGTQLVVSAKIEAKRLASSDTILKEEVEELVRRTAYARPCHTSCCTVLHL